MVTRTSWEPNSWADGISSPSWYSRDVSKPSWPVRIHCLAIFELEVIWFAVFVELADLNRQDEILWLVSREWGSFKYSRRRRSCLVNLYTFQLGIRSDFPNQDNQIPYPESQLPNSESHCLWSVLHHMVGPRVSMVSLPSKQTLSWGPIVASGCRFIMKISRFQIPFVIKPEY